MKPAKSKRQGGQRTRRKPLGKKVSTDVSTPAGRKQAARSEKLDLGTVMRLHEATFKEMLDVLSSMAGRRVTYKGLFKVLTKLQESGVQVQTDSREDVQKLVKALRGDRKKSRSSSSSA